MNRFGRIAERVAGAFEIWDEVKEAAGPKESGQTAAYGDEVRLFGSKGEIALLAPFEPPRGMDSEDAGESDELETELRMLKSRTSKVPALRRFRVKDEQWTELHGKFYAILVLKGTRFDETEMAQELSESGLGIITASERPSGHRTAFFHPKDTLHRGLTFEELITAVHSSEKTIDGIAVRKVFKEIMRDAMKDSEAELKSNMVQIIEEASQ